MDSKFIEEFDYLDKDQKNQMLINLKSYINHYNLKFKNWKEVQLIQSQKKMKRFYSQRVFLIYNLHLNTITKIKNTVIKSISQFILRQSYNRTLQNIKVCCRLNINYEELQEIERRWNTQLLEQIQLSSQYGQQQKIEMLESLLNLEKKNQKYDHKYTLRQILAENQ